MPFILKTVSARVLFWFAITAFLTVQGCTAAAVAYGVSKMATPAAPKAEPAQQVVRSTGWRSYPEYVTEMERINLEREKAGLPPRPIMTQEEWVSASQAGSPPTAAPAAPPGGSPSPESAPQVPAAK